MSPSRDEYQRREWKFSDTSRVDRRKPTDKSQPGLFAGATGESLHTSCGKKKCQFTSPLITPCKSANDFREC